MTAPTATHSITYQGTVLHILCYFFSGE